MKIVSPQVMRELDQKTIAGGTPGSVLMERAGRGLAASILQWIEDAELNDPSVLFVVGKGNNGGDAFVAAKCLADEGLFGEVALIAHRSDVKGDAEQALAELDSSGLDVREFPDGEFLDMCNGGGEWIVIDALLGTGSQGEPTGAVARAIEHINTLRDRAWVLSVDIPSGLNAETGEVFSPCVKADATITMGLPKSGLFSPDAVEVRGGLESVSIGISGDDIKKAEANRDAFWNAPEEVEELLSDRKRNSHKGTFGHVLVIGGTPGMSGAPALCALGALQVGAGLVTVLTPESIVSQVAQHAPELMVQAGPTNSSGGLAAGVWQDLRAGIEAYDVIVMGPGMGDHEDVLTFLRQLLRESTIPMVFDADALNALEGQPHWLDRARAPVVVTPHPGEMARLFGQTVEQIQHDRVGVATAAAKFAEVHVVLKGADTVIAPPEGPVYINTSGNPGMATGGTGDVLAGMIGGLAAQGVDLFDASRLGVYLHGKAGDLAALKYTQMAMTASHLLDELSTAIRSVKVR